MSYPDDNEPDDKRPHRRMDGFSWQAMGVVAALLVQTLVGTGWLTMMKAETVQNGKDLTFLRVEVSEMQKTLNAIGAGNYTREDARRDDKEILEQVRENTRRITALENNRP